MNFPKIASIAACALLAGCVFRSGADVSDNAAVPDTGGVSDMSTADATTGSDADTPVPDMGVPDGDAGGSDAGAEMGPDTGVPGFDFRAFRTHRVVVPYRQSFLPPTPSETPDIEDRLLQGHLHVVWSSEVTWVLSSDAVPADADLAVITTDADPMELSGGLDGTPWANPPLPMWVLSRSAYNDTYLMDGDPADVDNPDVTITEMFSELVVGLPPTFRAYTDDGRQVSSRDQPASGSMPLSFLDEVGASFAAVLAVETGGPLLQNQIAAGRRVADGIDEADAFTWESWMLTDNIIGYLLGEPPPFQPVANCTLVVGGTPGTVDFRVASRMRRNGCDVELSATPSGDDSIVVISPTTSPAIVANLSAHSAPIIAVFGAAGSLSALQISPAALPAPTPGTSWNVSTEVMAGLRANLEGAVQVQGSGSILSVPLGDLPPGTLSVATAEGDTGSSTYFVIEAGAELRDGPAAGDRVGISIGPTMWNDATPDGMAMFDAALQWAMWRIGGS